MTEDLYWRPRAQALRDAAHAACEALREASVREREMEELRARVERLCAGLQLLRGIAANNEILHCRSVVDHIDRLLALDVGVDGERDDSEDEHAEDQRGP